MDCFKRNKRKMNYAIEYVNVLNEFYDKYKNSINENILNEEYDLMTDILDELIYNHCDSGYINFKKNKYRNHVIYKTNKSYGKTLSKLYKKMWIIEFGF